MVMYLKYIVLILTIFEVMETRYLKARKCKEEDLIITTRPNETLSSTSKSIVTTTPNAVFSFASHSTVTVTRTPNQASSSASTSTLTTTPKEASSSVSISTVTTTPKETSNSTASLCFGNADFHDPNNITITTTNGSVYYITGTDMTYQCASEACSQVGGHLAAMTSTAEKKIGSSRSNKQMLIWAVWIGLNKVNGTYQWVTGEDFDFEDTDVKDTVTDMCGAMQYIYEWLGVDECDNNDFQLRGLCELKA